MLHLTSQERLALISLLSVIMIGQFILLVSQKCLLARLALEGLNEQLYVHQMNINKASMDELIALPFIGEFTARKIIEYRAKFGRFQSIEEIADIPGVRKDLYDQFVIYLKAGPS